MKKSIVTSAALAFALGAFADGVPTIDWFSASPGSLGGGSWTLTPTATEPAVESGKWVIDTETPGTDDAIYTPTALTAGKKTRVALDIAFGAAYPANELPTAATGAQAGLVLGIANDATNFYGLTSAGWTKMSGGVPENLDTEITVTVEIDYEANPVTLSYKVGDTVLADASDSSITTFQRFTATATSLVSVGFAGSGKVASIDGNADAKYAVGGTGYLAFNDAVTAAAGASPVVLYSNAAYTFPSTGNTTLQVQPTGSYTFSPTYPQGAFVPAPSSASGVTTYTVKNTATFGGGEGTQVAPYIIANATDFAELAHFAASDTFSGKYFSQTADVVATAAIPQFAGIYNGGNKALSIASGAIFTAANGATFNNIAFAGALIGTASGAITASGCTMTGSVKPVTTIGTGATVSGLNFATLASDIYTFCATPSATGSYYVMLDNDEDIAFGAAVGDTLALTAFDAAAYTGDVTTEVAQSKVTEATVSLTTTYTIAWDTVEVTIANADNGTVTDVEAGTSGQKPTLVSGTTYMAVKGDTLTVTYTAAPNYVYSGKQTTTTVQFVADTGASATPPTFTLGKAKYNDELYATVQGAVDAASAGGDVVLVADSSDAVAINKNVTFKGADVAVGDISFTAASTLTIENGKYGAINPMAGASIALKGGYYQSEADDVQAWCYAGFFAEAYEGSPYITQVVEGTIVVPTGADADKVPAIAVEPGVIPASEDTPEKQTTYLATEQANGQPRWVNYTLGIDGTDSDNEPKLGDAGDASKVVVDLTNGQLKQGTGITAELQVKDGGDWKPSSGVIELVDSMDGAETGSMRLVLKDVNSKATEVTEVDYGLKAQTPSNALDIISVPFTKLGSSDGLPLSQVLKLKNIANGDKIYRYNAGTGANEAWTLTDGEWVGSTDPVVTPGEGLWLERADASKPIFYFGGYDPTRTIQTPVAKSAWALVANPNPSEAKSLAAILSGASDKVQVMVETGAEPKIYTYEGSTWGYNKTVTEKRTIGKKTVDVKKVVRVTDDSNIQPGQGFWIGNGGDSAITVDWTVGE